ncbi:MAG TPA: peptidylprolyl isomerase [Actinomycetaceae bacterium]|nr:peptidylprolyl isomerase [Actinomycetaceae bacterium]
MTRTTKQERAYQKRRLEKRDERARAKAARNRRMALTVAAVVGIAVIIAAIALLLGNTGEDPDPAATEPGTAEVPDPARAEGRAWQATIHTNLGDIAVELDGAAAPQATANFLALASDGFYDETECHRLLPTSLLQCGDPTGTGTGGPGYSFGPIENAPPDDLYPAGTLAMARQGNNAESMGSQFFLVFADVPLPADAAGGYSVFGHVTEGLDILRQVGEAGTVEGSEQPAQSVTIEGVTIE